MVFVSACKQLQENQAVAWILKTKGKNPPKQESLVFLETTVHRVGEKAENQRKTREKSKVVENQVFWLNFCAKIKDCAYTLWLPGYFADCMLSGCLATLLTACCLAAWLLCCLPVVWLPGYFADCMLSGCLATLLTACCPAAWLLC